MEAIRDSRSRFTGAIFWRAVGAGLIASVVTAAFMIAAMKSGMSPLPKPLGLAFAQWVTGKPLPLPVGLLFHVAYVTSWSTLFILVFPRWLRFWPILAFGLALWLLSILVFTPLVGWGVAAMGVAGPKGVLGTLAPHLVFVVALWLSCLWLFRSGDAAATSLA